jgi:hypothetical protein
MVVSPASPGRLVQDESAVEGLIVGQNELVKGSRTDGQLLDDRAAGQLHAQIELVLGTGRRIQPDVTHSLEPRTRACNRLIAIVQYDQLAAAS